jgi:hypothetical protein
MKELSMQFYSISETVSLISAFQAFARSSFWNVDVDEYGVLVE